jgi:hypothetical protein
MSTLKHAVRSLLIVAVSLAQAIGATIAIAQPQTRLDSAVRAIKRLPPSAFPQLPVAVQHELERRTCTIPQAFSSERPHNVVSGRFLRASQVDWAVLCSVRDSSRIIVFWNGSTTNPTELAPEPDEARMQGIGEGKLGYSRGIGVARPITIRYFARELGGWIPRPLDHDGIDDAFIEKASTIHFLHRGKWLQLQGMD